MTLVQTVAGPISSTDLGVTLGHEHVYVSMGNDARHYRWMFDWDATRENTVRQLAEARDVGVATLIDLTTPDFGRDVSYVRDVAASAGVNVVVATGLWRDIPRSFWTRTPEEVAEIFIREAEVGIDDTDIRAGVIKVASDVGGVTPEAGIVLRGAALAHRATGLPIATHQWAPEEVGRDQIRILRDAGVSMDRVCIGHSTDTTDVKYLEDLLQAGVFLSMDRYPGAAGRPDWQQRNETVAALVVRGWASRMMLGHDHATFPVRRGEPPKSGPSPTGFRFLFDVATPDLRARGVPEAAIDAMLREAPRHFLAGFG